MQPQSTHNVQPTVRTFVVRSSDGKIVHLHEEVTFESARPSEDAADRALRLASPRARAATVEEVAPGFRPSRHAGDVVRPDTDRHAET